jgi:hypothetical protein
MAGNKDLIPQDSAAVALQKTQYLVYITNKILVNKVNRDLAVINVSG